MENNIHELRLDFIKKNMLELFLAELRVLLTVHKENNLKDMESMKDIENLIYYSKDVLDIIKKLKNGE